MLEERLYYLSIPSIDKNITKWLSYEEKIKKCAIKKYNKEVLFRGVR
jgi:hypothetical protein